MGKIEAICLEPCIPLDLGEKIFAKNRPVELYLSDDSNKIPIKLKVNLKYGNIEMELASYNGLKESLSFQQ